MSRSAPDAADSSCPAWRLPLALQHTLLAHSSSPDSSGHNGFSEEFPASAEELPASAEEFPASASAATGCVPHIAIITASSFARLAFQSTSNVSCRPSISNFSLVKRSTVWCALPYTAFAAAQSV